MEQLSRWTMIKIVIILLTLCFISCTSKERQMQKEPHKKDFELELKSIDIFLFNEVCDTYIHPPPFTLSGYGFRISLINHSNDTLRLKFNTNISYLKDNQEFLTEFEMFKIEEKIVVYDDYELEKIQIKPKDSFTFTLRDADLSSSKFEYFDEILDNVLFLKDDLKFHLNSISINDSLGFIFDIKKDIPRYHFIDNEKATKNDKIKRCFENYETPPPPPLD